MLNTLLREILATKRLFTAVLALGLLTSCFSRNSASPSLAAAAAESSCVATDSAISKYTLKSWSQESWADTSTTDLHCDPASVEFKTREAMELLSSLKDLEIAAPDFARSFAPTTPYTAFEQKVDEIRFDKNPKSSSCTGGTMAYVQEGIARTVHICPSSAGLTPLNLASTLLHEAHHLSGDAKGETLFKHQICEFGLFLGYPSCDKNYETGGAYAVQVEFLMRVARTPGVSMELRHQAYVMSILNVKEHFNKMHFDVADGVLALTEDGQVLFYDPLTDSSMPIIDGIGDHDVLTLRSLPTVFNATTGEVTTSPTAFASIPTPGSFAKMYSLFSEEKRKTLLDVYFSGASACFLFTDTLYCEQNNDSVELSIASLKPLHFSTTEGFGGDIVLIASENGDMYMLPFNFPLEDWDISRFFKNKTLTQMKSTILLPFSNNVGINMKGELVVFEKITEQTPLPQFKNQRFRKLLGPYRWSPHFAYPQI